MTGRSYGGVVLLGLATVLSTAMCAPFGGSDGTDRIPAKGDSGSSSGMAGAGAGAGGSSSSSGSSSSGNSSGGSGGQAVVPPEGCRFDNGSSFALPSGFAIDQLDDLQDNSGASCIEGELSFATLDMDGDLLPDLVVTDHCDIAGVGTGYWEIYYNQGSGFSDTAVQFTLPSGFFTDQLDDLNKDSGGSCVQGELSYATRDLNGDLRPDLIVTDRCDIEGVGSEEWQVYLATDVGFSNTAISWALPSGFNTDQLDDVTDDSGGSCVQGELSFALLDMNADNRPDLVVTDHCDFNGTGTNSWEVFLNLGNGFAQDPLFWDLPPGFGSDAFDDIAADDGGGCAVGELSYITRDIDADLRPDLIVTDNCDYDGVGTSHWLVFLNTGDGFAQTPVNWPLPEDFATDQLDDASDDSSGSCLQGELSFALINGNGDLYPDLVVTDKCDIDHTGTTHWAIYRNNASGFDDAQSWTLPSGFGTDAFDDLSFDKGGFCTQGEFSGQTMDFNGDGVADFILSDDCDFDGVGTTHWQVFLGSCG